MSPTIEEIKARWEELGPWRDAGFGYVTQPSPDGHDEPGMPGVVGICAVKGDEEADCKVVAAIANAPTDISALMDDLEHHRKFARLVLESTDLADLQQAARALLKGE